MSILPNAFQGSNTFKVKVKSGEVFNLDLELAEKGAIILIDIRDNKGKIETGFIKLIGTNTISITGEFLIIKKVHQVGKYTAFFTSGNNTRVVTCDAIELLDGDNGVDNIDLTYTFKYI